MLKPVGILLAFISAAAIGQTPKAPVKVTGQAPEFVTAYANRIVFTKDNALVCELPTEGVKRVVWSPNGQYLAVWSGPSKPIQILQTPLKVDPKSEWVPTATLQSKTWLPSSTPPIWAPDSNSLVSEKEGGGIIVGTLKGADWVETELLPVGHKPNWSPDSTRIVFAGEGEGGGLWVMSKDGAKPRKVLSGEIVWGMITPGGHAYLSIAKEASDFVLTRTWIDGSQTKKIASMDPDDFSLSPGSPYAIFKRKGDFGLLNVSTGTTFPFPANIPVHPQWVGPARVLAALGNRAYTIELTKKGLAATQLKLPGNKENAPIVDVQKRVGLFLSAGMFEVSPFNTLTAPPEGQLRLDGTIDSVDPEDGSVTLLLDKAVYSNAAEFVPPSAIRKKLILERGVFGSGGRLVQIGDFTPDHEVSVTVNARDMSSPGQWTIQSAYLPEVVSIQTEPGRRHPKNHVNHPPLPIEYDGVTRVPVVVPMTYPLMGEHKGSGGFLDKRGGGKRRHHGNDLMGKKMRPLVATFDGTIMLRQNGGTLSGNDATLVGDNGFKAVYRHMNNDTPGTNDGSNDWRFCFAPGLSSGDHVVEGQLIGYLGNSGNAETTPAHCHFELIDIETGAILDPYPSLKAASHVAEPTYENPLPEFFPRAVNEARLDGLIADIDPAKGEVRLDVIAQSNGGKKLRPVTYPTIQIVKVAKDCSIFFGFKKSRRAQLSWLKPGMFASVLGVKGTLEMNANALLADLKGR